MCYSTFTTTKKSQDIILLDICVNTQDRTFFTRRLNKRLEHLSTCLTRLQQKINTSKPHTYEQPIRGILTAPEYYFAKCTESDAGERQYSEKTARSLQEHLVAISSKFPQILIIPGTIAWKKGAPKPEPKDHLGVSGISNPIFNNLQQLEPVKQLSQEEYRKSQEKRGITYQENHFLRYSKKFRDSSHTLAKSTMRSSAANNYGYNSTFLQQGLISKNDPQTKLTTLNQKSIDDVTLSKNTVYFYLNGRRVYKYHKCSDYQEVLGNQPNVFVQGKKTPTVEICGIIFGIEICLDHSIGLLKQHIANNSGLIDSLTQQINDNQGVDIHLILSATVNNNPDNYCTKSLGGYVIHSSSFFGNRRYAQNNERLQTLPFEQPLIENTNLIALKV